MRYLTGWLRIVCKPPIVKFIMTTEKHLIGLTNDIVEGGKGIVFKAQSPSGEIAPAFVVQFDAQYFAYLNRCGHIAVRLDYREGEFFSDDGQTLVCSTHGAEYAPDSGACLGGPCYGIGLEPLAITENEGQLYLAEEGFSVIADDAATAAPSTSLGNIPITEN